MRIDPSSHFGRHLRHRFRGIALAGVAVAATSACTTPSPYPERATLPSMETAYALPTERCGDYLVVQTRIDGAGPFPLLLDSGAGRTILDPHVVAEAGLGRTIDSLAMGEYVVREFGYGTLDMEELSSALGRRIDGILGHPVFAGVLLEWDVHRGTVAVSAGSLDPSDPGVVPAREHRRPFVGSIVGTDTLWVLIDTGSSHGLTLRDPDRFEYLTPLEVTGARTRVDGVHLVRSGRLAGEVRIGPMRVDRPVVVNSVSVDLVGQDVLRHFRITFDQVNDLIRFQRPDAALETPEGSPPVRTLGVGLGPHPDHAEVVHVVDGGPAEGRLREGDRIVAMDGTPWSERGCSDPDAPLEEGIVEVLVVREGDTLRVDVPARVLHRVPADDSVAPPVSGSRSGR